MKTKSSTKGTPSNKCRVRILALGILVLCTHCVSAAQWSSTEIHYQRGNLDNAYAGNDSRTTIFTLQHASGWQFGSNFFFIDQLATKDNDDFYGEWYSTFSLGKITEKTIGAGPLADVGIVLGVNVAADANAKKYLPGVSLLWNVPGFTLFETLITAYIDDSEGQPVPKEDNSFMIDWVWNYPFIIAEQHFSISGHMEYIHKRDNEYGGEVESWILAQPQFRYDIGHTLFDVDNQLFVGLEYQYWLNKLGDGKTDEKTAQLLLVWRL